MSFSPYAAARPVSSSRHARFVPAVVVAVLLTFAVACGGLETAVCGLAELGTAIQDDLDELLALDPEQVAQPGTPDNLAALAALDALDATIEEAQSALDSASDDEVGPIVREAFQAALDLSAAASEALRGAIESGDPKQVAAALGTAQLASDAIGVFLSLVDGLGVECPGTASPSAAASDAPDPTVQPTPTLEPTPVPTVEPTPVSTAAPTPTAAPTATPEPSAATTPVPTPVPTPAPTPTATPSPGPTTTASPSPSEEPTPSPSEPATPDEGGTGLLAWIVVLGVLGTGAAAFVLWYTNRKGEESDLDDEPPAETPEPPSA
jgi:outer membrane biosynthesis protein TonB